MRFCLVVCCSCESIFARDSPEATVLAVWCTARTGNKPIRLDSEYLRKNPWKSIRIGANFPIIPSTCLRLQTFFYRLSVGYPFKVSFQRNASENGRIPMSPQTAEITCINRFICPTAHVSFEAGSPSKYSKETWWIFKKLDPSTSWMNYWVVWKRLLCNSITSASPTGSQVETVSFNQVAWINRICLFIIEVCESIRVQ